MKKLLMALAMAMACGGEAYEEETAELGTLEQPLTGPMFFGWELTTDGYSEQRCQFNSNSICMYPKAKGLIVSTGTGWNLTERDVIKTHVQWIVEQLGPVSVVGHIVQIDNPLPPGTTNAIQINKASTGQSFPPLQLREVADFMQVGCAVQGPNMIENPSMQGRHRVCTRHVAAFSSFALQLWSGQDFSPLSNKLHQALGFAVTRALGHGSQTTQPLAYSYRWLDLAQNQNYGTTENEQCRMGAFQNGSHLEYNGNTFACNWGD